MVIPKSLFRLHAFKIDVMLRQLTQYFLLLILLSNGSYVYGQAAKKIAPVRIRTRRDFILIFIVDGRAMTNKLENPE